MNAETTSEADESKELRVSLSGNLGFVSLDEVLRLLTRSNQQGSVEVHGDGVQGRIFVTKGGIALATTSNDHEMHEHLIKSGLADGSFLEDVEAGNSTLAPIVEKSGGALTELLREMTVESIYQLGLNGDAFEVREGVATRYASPEMFELENLLNDAKQRIADWAEVSKSVADLTATMRLTSDLGDREEVKIDRDAWRVVSEIGSGSSVVAIASQLGTTEFWTARVASRLIKQDLVSFETAPEAPHTDVHEPVAHVADSAPDPQESWWQEPEDETQPIQDEPVEEPGVGIPAAVEPVDYDEPVTTYDEESASDREVESEVEETDATSDVEEDTEAFLEKVFSELDSGEADEPEEEGYGLLRRRRLGAMRDAANDS